MVYVYGGFLKWWYPQNAPKWSFLVGKPMVVGETHHFRVHPHIKMILSSETSTSRSSFPQLQWRHSKQWWRPDQKGGHCIRNPHPNSSENLGFSGKEKEPTFSQNKKDCCTVNDVKRCEKMHVWMHQRGTSKNVMDACLSIRSDSILFCMSFHGCQAIWLDQAQTMCLHYRHWTCSMSSFP